jgi:hypothetical protein
VPRPSRAKRSCVILDLVKTRRRFIVVLGAFAVLAIFVTSFALSSRFQRLVIRTVIRYPSDADLIEAFQVHRDELDALASMARADQYPVVCRDGPVDSGPRPRPTAERIAEYEALLKDADVRCAWYEAEPEAVRLGIWAFGFPGTSTARGFISIAPEAVQPQRCTDEPECWEGRRGRAYRRLTGDWHIVSW